MSRDIPVSSIEFLTSCSTGIDLIPGYASVHYWVYTAEAINEPPSATQRKSLDVALFEAEIAFRDKKYILYHDEQRHALWFFLGTLDSPGLYPPELLTGTSGIEEHGWTFKSKLSGVFKPNELTASAARLAAVYSASQPTTPTGMPTAAANARGLQHNAATSAHSTIGPASDRGDLRTIYKFFMLGVQMSFAYTLACEGKALQLDSRTYVATAGSSSTSGDADTTSRLTVFTIDHYLANGGGLLVSTNISDAITLYPHSNNFQSHNRPAEAIIAPGGAVVEVLHHSRADDNVNVRQWKALVKQQLRGKGINLGVLDPEDRWLLIKTHSMDNTVFYWPLALCFAISTESTNLAHRSIQDSFGISWFITPDGGGNREPVGFAQDWYDGKSVRDRVRDDRRKQAEMEKKQIEASNLGVTSPNFPRDGLQATAGVYPTPPDGLPQPPHGLGVPESQNLPLPIDPGIHRSSLDMQHSEMMDLDLGPFEDSVRQRPGVMSRNSLDGGAKLIKDDLFGDDMEDEDLRGPDITDADFSFFDEPEEPDVLMLDGIDRDGDAEGQESTQISPPKRQSISPKNPIQRQTNGNDMKEANGINAAPFPDLKSSNRTDPGRDLKSDVPMEDEQTLHIPQVGEPLSPSLIRRKLFDFAINPSHSTKRASQFQPLAFNNAMATNDAKYRLEGAFAFKRPSPNAGEARSATSPYIQSRLPNSQLRRPSLYPGTALTAPGRRNSLDSDASSDCSDSSSADSLYENGTRSIVSSSTRARLYDGYSGEDAQSTAGTNLPIQEGFNLPVDDQPRFLNCVLLRSHPHLRQQASTYLSQPQIHLEDSSSLEPEQLLPPLLQSAGPLNPFHKDFINVAQLVAEQLAIGSVNAKRNLNCSSREIQQDHTLPLRSILNAVRSCFDDISHCDLLTWLCVQEQVPERQNVPRGHPLAPQKKTTIPGLQTSEGTPVPSSALAPLGPPHLRVRRNDCFWDVLPPALPFWEQLGLGPATGKKNMMAFCIYPGGEGLDSQVSVFIDYLSATFESCKLGAHVRASQIGDITMGLVPVKLAVEQRTFQTAVQAIRDACVELGKQLAGIDWNSKLEYSPAVEDLGTIDNFVIYIVNPFEDEPRGLMELCASFWELYEAYSQALTSPVLQASRPDVALQILPMSHVANPQFPVVMDASYFQKLVREVYDRCPPAGVEKSSSRLPIESGAAVQLEQPLPRKIDFKIQVDPPTDLLHEASNMHLGYSRSRNHEWVSVAWTDTTGKYQASSNYCLLGGKSFAEVARVIWHSTIEIMQARRVAWRLCIARAGVIEKDELEAWSMLATSASPVVMITVIMSVDPAPPISVFHDHPLSTSKSAVSGTVSTPVGTPGVSPDTVFTPAATPNADTGLDTSNDPDAHLVDIGDETWGLILGHRTNATDSIIDYRPSLSTGYLLKSNAAPLTPLDDMDEPESGLILVGIKLVWIGSSPKPVPAPQPPSQQQPAHIPIQSPFGLMTSGLPLEMSTNPPSTALPPATPTVNTPSGQPQTAQMNTSTSGSSIPKITADSILRDYLQMYRNLGVLARARGLKGTRRGALPWHVVVAMRAAEGLEASYGTMQTSS